MSLLWVRSCNKCRPNTLYPGPLGRAMYDWNEAGRLGPSPASQRIWIQFAPKGLPMTVREGKKILRLLTQSSMPKINRFEIWLILNKLNAAASSFVSSQRDQVLEWAENPQSYIDRMRNVEPVSYPLILFDKTALPRGEQHARLPLPTQEEGLMIDIWAASLLHDGQPGLKGMVYGLMMDYGCCVHCRSVWGYLLGKAISPNVNWSAQAIVSHRFVYVVAKPGLYQAAIERMVLHDRSTYFVDPGAASVTITRISVNEAMAPNFGREDILHNC